MYDCQFNMLHVHSQSIKVQREHTLLINGLSDRHCETGFFLGNTMPG